MSEKLNPSTSISKGGGRLDTTAHEVDLHEITSHQYSLNGVADGLTSDQKFYVLKRLDLNHLKSFEDLPPSAVFMLEKSWRSRLLRQKAF